MPSIVKLVKTLQYAVPREYARLRLGVTRAEAHSYNTTKRVLLTFDDFGTAETVKGVLTLLEKENVKAVFFLNGNWADAHPELVGAIARAGHWIGNHSYSHPHLNQLSDDKLREEIHKGPKGKLLRPPYGDYNAHVRKVAAEYGFKIAFWTIDSWDWKGLSAAEMLEIILPRLRPGACILMHLNAPHTLEMLPKLIAGIRARGFELCHDGTEIKV